MNNKIFAFVGIAPAPEFLDRLMWKKLKLLLKELKKQLINEKFFIFLIMVALNIIFLII